RQRPGQGRPDPRRAARWHRAHARDRRRDGRGCRCLGRGERSMSEPVVLALDLGTNEVKAGLVTLDGRLGALARAGYPMAGGRGPGWAELGPGAWWSGVVGAVRGLHATRTETGTEVVAIGVDGHGPTLVAVDERGEATREAITWLDTRSSV